MAFGITIAHLPLVNWFMENDNKMYDVTKDEYAFWRNKDSSIIGLAYIVLRTSYLRLLYALTDLTNKLSTLGPCPMRQNSDGCWYLRWKLYFCDCFLLWKKNHLSLTRKELQWRTNRFPPIWDDRFTIALRHLGSFFVRCKTDPSR